MKNLKIDFIHLKLSKVYFDYKRNVNQCQPITCPSNEHWTDCSYCTEMNYDWGMARGDTMILIKKFLTWIVTKTDLDEFSKNRSG